MTRNLVSVVMPCYNHGRYLREAVDSVLGQTHPAVELIVVDDGSEDDTPDVLKAYGSRIRALRQPNRGRSAARNRGLDEARGQFVKLLDADDKLDPECLERQVRAMGSDLPWSESASFSFEDESSEIAANLACLPEEPLWRRLLVHGGMPSCAPLVCTEVVGQTRFRTGLTWGEDALFWSDIWANLGHPEKIPFVEGAVCLVRQHSKRTHRTATQYDVLLFIRRLIESWENDFIPNHPWVVETCVDSLLRVARANLRSERPDRRLHRETLRCIRRFCKRHGRSSHRTVIGLEGRRWVRRVRSAARPLRWLIPRRRPRVGPRNRRSQHDGTVQ